MNASSASLSALLLNNEGVILLLQNRDQEAISFFSKSLALMKTTLMKSMNDVADSAMKPRLVVCHDATHPLPSFRRDSNDHSFLYTEAFTFFSSELDDGSRLESSTASVFSAVVLFNAALVYHKQAKLHGRQVCFAKAEKMYEMVGRLLQPDSPGNHHHHHAAGGGTALVVKLAALNNLSLILHEQSNFELSRKGFQLLARTIDSVASSATLSSSQMDVEGMLLNVLCASAPTIAPAA
jgi:hypothetical protein